MTCKLMRVSTLQDGSGLGVEAQQRAPRTVCLGRKVVPEFVQ